MPHSFPTASQLAEMTRLVPSVAESLRFISTPQRLLLLCQLSQGEATVGALERLTGIQQPALSQQLGELRRRGILSNRRESRQVFYRVVDPQINALVRAMYDIFCREAD